ncbi:MAG: hypothetical protein EA369_00090 [Bradymonadales bacterium]|nr:MAG: hypothetical protein EA369_00090 [Bradymonadales bacterium]
MDLHPDYWAAAKRYIPQAKRIPDKFHVVQRLNQAIDEALRELVYKQTGTLARGIPRDQRWIIRKHLKNQTNFQKLEKLKTDNQQLFDLYLLKDYFTQFFEFQASELAAAQKFLVEWVTEAWATGIKAFQDFAHYVRRNYEPLLQIIQTGRTSSICEGINNKISTLKSIAYGYHLIDYFKLKILQRCGVLGMPTNHTKTS